MEYSSVDDYFLTPLKEEITVDSIVTLHYFEFASDYVFKGEKHNFWEFLYVDKGEVEIMAETRGYKLEQGDIVFHKPNEFHSVWANGRIAPNIVVISFSSNSKAMNFFEGKIMKLTDYCRDLLGEIIRAARDFFSNDFGHGYNRLVEKESPKFGSGQLVKLYLEMLLIQLVREDISVNNKDRLSLKAKERVEEDMVSNIIEYMRQNINENLSIDDICTKFYLGRTHLKTMFKKSSDKSIMSYFNNMKIEEAKRLIREGKNNFTQISDMLGYNSVNYFSSSFKKYTNMSPSEYAVSVKAKAES